VITWQKAWPHFILFFLYFFVFWWIRTAIGSNYLPEKNMPETVMHNPFVIIPSTIRLVQMLAYYIVSYKTIIVRLKLIEKLL